MKPPRFDPFGEFRNDLAMSGLPADASSTTEPVALDGTSALSSHGQVAQWVISLTKAMRGARVYAENNEMHHRFMDGAHEGLTALLENRGQLDLVVRDDRLLVDDEVIYQDDDRREGLPFILYRNTFRRLTFLKGMAREELIAFIGALNSDDYDYDYAGEDLVSALWRLKLPHLHYVTIDTLSTVRSLEKPSDENLSRQELDQIQQDIDGIIAQIYKTGASEDDTVRALSIAREDLEVLKDVRSVDLEELDRLEEVTSRAIAEVPEQDFEAAAAFLAEDNREALTRRMMDILVKILLKEDSAEESASTLALLQQLYDALILEQRYADARSLVERLIEQSNTSSDMKEMHVAQHLLRMFTAESRVLPMLDALNDGYRTVPISELVAFIRSLGSMLVPALLAGLGNLDSTSHRRLICDLIVKAGVPEVGHLEKRAKDAKWFVVRDILELARHHPLPQITRLVHDGLNHPHPKVRVQAVQILRSYGPGAADEFIAARLRDMDTEVRIVAARVASSRRQISSLPAFEAILREDLSDRDHEELRVLLGAYANIGREEAVPMLAELLMPGLLAQLKSTDVQVAAASALGLISSEEAQRYLRRGTRALSSRVREACKVALAHSMRGMTSGDIGELIDPSSVEVNDWTSNAADFDISHRALDPAPPESSPPSHFSHPALRSGPPLPMVDTARTQRTDEIPVGLLYLAVEEGQEEQREVDSEPIGSTERDLLYEEEIPSSVGGAESSSEEQKTEPQGSFLGQDDKYDADASTDEFDVPKDIELNSLSPLPKFPSPEVFEDSFVASKSSNAAHVTTKEDVASRSDSQDELLASFREAERGSGQDELLASFREAEDGSSKRGSGQDELLASFREAEDGSSKRRSGQDELLASFREAERGDDQDELSTSFHSAELGSLNTRPAISMSSLGFESELVELPVDEYEEATPGFIESDPTRGMDAADVEAAFERSLIHEAIEVDVDELRSTLSGLPPVDRKAVAEPSTKRGGSSEKDGHWDEIVDILEPVDAPLSFRKASVVPVPDSKSSSDLSYPPLPPPPLPPPPPLSMGWRGEPETWSASQPRTTSDPPEQHDVNTLDLAADLILDDPSFEHSS